MATLSNLPSLIKLSRVAVKKMPHNTDKEKASCLNEVEIVSKSSHPCIVGYIGSFFEASKKELWMLVKYLDGGNLHEALKQTRFGVEEVAYVADHLLSGLKYLHDAGVSLCICV